MCALTGPGAIRTACFARLISRLFSERSAVEDDSRIPFAGEQALLDLHNPAARSLTARIGGGSMLCRALYLAACTCLALCRPAIANASEYILQELAVLPGASSENVGALNLQGELVGGALANDAVHRAWLVSEAGFELIPADPESDYSSGRGINDGGEIVGSFNTANAMRAFRWSTRRGIQRLPPLKGDSSSEAFGINRSGEVVGTSSGPAGIRAVRWNPGGAVQELPGLTRNTYSRAIAINNRGTVIGTVGRPPHLRAVIWTGAGVEELSVLPGHEQSEALGLNEAGDIVGWSSGPQGTRAVLWSAGKVQDLGALQGLNAKLIRARAINGRGDVVGDWIGEHSSRAFIWTRNGGMRDLNSLIPQSSPYLLAEAVAINDLGHIVAVGHQHDSHHDEEGEHGAPVRILLLVPAR
jgi:probable HAF family extracellular repeat protein